MKFVEAFNSLGYERGNHQNAWSAEKDDGVCITIWQKENCVDDRGLPFNDIRDQVSSDADWLSKSGNRMRKKHIARALTEFDGRVDVIILYGEPGRSYENAEPWNVEQRHGRYWHVTEFDQNTGLFRAEIAPETRKGT